MSQSQARERREARQAAESRFEVELPDVAVVIPNECYLVGGSGYVYQADLDSLSAVHPTLVDDSSWREMFGPRLDTLRIQLLDVFPKAQASLERAPDYADTPWQLVVNYGLSLSEAGAPEIAERHARVMRAFTEIVGEDDAEMISIVREMLAR